MIWKTIHSLKRVEIGGIWYSYYMECTTFDQPKWIKKERMNEWNLALGLFSCWWVRIHFLWFFFNKNSWRGAEKKAVSYRYPAIKCIYGIICNSKHNWINAATISTITIQIFFFYPFWCCSNMNDEHKSLNSTEFTVILVCFTQLKPNDCMTEENAEKTSIFFIAMSNEHTCK